MPPGFAALLGESPAVVALRHDLQQLVRRYAGARRLPPVLVLGESGTGKTLIARVLHHEGSRAARPFVDVACPAIPESLMESQMFGFERGAFTDARESRPGLFTAADRGTIFLDEIGLLPDNLQVKLLKVVEDQQLRPLGATVSKPIDVWVIAATSEDLESAVRKRRFREDLYYRLAVVTVHVPPLRKRGEDVVILARHLLARACADYRLAPKTFAPEALERLREHRWPGNIRELGNVMERVALRFDGAVVTPEALELPDPPGRSAEAFTRRPGTAAPEAGDGSEMSERDRLAHALAATGRNVSRAAALLGLTRNTFRYRLRKTGLSPRRGKAPAPEAVVPAPADQPLPAAVTHWERRRIAFLRVALLAPGDEADTRASLLLDEVRQKVLVFGGAFDGLSPTGITAVFGLDAAEDATARAAHAAMAIRKLGARARELDPVTPLVKLALHAAPILLRRLEDRAHVDGDARPELWELLQRLLDRAAAGDIVVSGPATAALGPAFLLSDAGDDTSRLLEGERPTGPRTTRGIFLGRGDEMAMLQGRLERALVGRGQVVAIDGEPGIGKSRVLFEFHRALEPGRARYVLARCVSHGRELPLLPAVELVRRLSGIAEDEKPDVIVAKVRSTLTGLGMPVDDCAPFLLRLIGLREGTERIAHLSPQSLHQRSVEVFRELVLAACRVRPLVVAVEDLHWIDRASEGYLAALVDVLADSPVLLVTTCRTGYAPPWRDRSYLTELRLQPLARADARRVLDDAFEREHRAAPTDETTEAILARADGNPFFIEELVRAVGPAPASPAAVPETIEGVLLGRIDRLTGESKAVLQAAAVLGRDVPLRVLEAIVPQIPAWRERLRELQGLEYLYEVGARARACYRFKHALTQEVAYASLLPAQCHALHAQIVEAIEAQYAGRLDEQTEELAHHAVRGRRWDRAVTYLRQAGLKAARRAANHEAVVCFEQALETLARLPGGAPATVIDLRLDLFRALVPLGHYPRCEEHLTQAAQVAARHGERRRLGHVLGGQCLMRRAAGALEESIAAGREALAIAAEVGDVELATATNLWLGTTFYTRAQFRDAIACFRASFSAPTAGRAWVDARSANAARSWLAWALESLGEFEEALGQGHQALAVAEAQDDRLMQASVSCLLANVYLGLAEVPRAIELLEPALTLCLANGHRDFLGPVQMRLGFAYALVGRFSESIRLGEEGVATCRAIGAITGYPTRLAGLAQSYLLASLPVEAEKTARDGATLAHDLGQPAGEAWCLHVLGLVGARANDSTAAKTHFRRSRDLARTLEMRPLVAHNEVGLATVYRATNRPVEADRALATALKMYEQMGMVRWIERARAS